MFIIAGIGIPDYWSLLIILLIVLILFGPKNLPKIGGAIGRSIREFKNGMSSLGGEVEDDAASAKKPVQPMKRERAEALPGSAPADDKQAAQTESETARREE